MSATTEDARVGEMTRVAEMCLTVASNIYEGDSISDDEIEWRAKYLFMVFAHESGMAKWRRQIGHKKNTRDGAFGLWQMQEAEILAAFGCVVNSPRLLDRSNDILGEDFDVKSHETLLTVIQTKRGDMLACILALVHTLNISGNPFPHGIDDCATHAKKKHNTTDGKATPSMYSGSFRAAWPGDCLLKKYLTSEVNP